MSTLLRAPVLDDFEMLVSWVPDGSACARWAGPQMPFPFAADELPTLLMIDRIRSFSMVANDNAFVGFGQFWSRGEKVVHLGRIIVAPHKRGAGLGTALCKLLIAEALRATNAEKVTLRVYRDNAAAFSIYSKLGFSGAEDESNSGVLAMERRAQ